MAKRSSRSRAGAGRATTRNPVSAAPYRRPLSIEPLESRHLLAVVTVDTPLDVVDFNDGLTSLREAIFATNLVEGHDTIRFDFGHDGPATILLTQGELTISDDLTIEGPGSDLLTIDASGSDPTPELKKGDGSRVFNIDDGLQASQIDVTLSGLTITGGDTIMSGAGIRTVENLRLQDVDVTRNYMLGIREWGGGIYASGAALLIEDSLIHENLAPFFTGGGIVIDKGSLTLINTVVSGNYASLEGGGIHAERSQVSILDSELRANSSQNGAGIYMVSGDLDVLRTTIAANSALSNGGGAYLRLVPSAALVDSRIIDNLAGSEGAGIHGSSSDIIIQRTAVEENESRGRGGGAMLRGNIQIMESFFRDNFSRADGGALAVSGTISVIDSELYSNIAWNNGGGVHLEGSPSSVTTAYFRNTSIVRNRASARGGGAAWDAFTAVEIVNSTISSNTAGGIDAPGIGGGLYGVGPLQIRSSTVTRNSAVIGGSGHPSGDGGGMDVFDVVMENTVVAQNHGAPADIRIQIGGTIEASFSLIGDDRGSNLAPSPQPDSAGNLIGSRFAPIDPGLAPLRRNGGPTPTHAPLPGSPLIDTGRPGPVTAPEFDQRGAPFVRIHSQGDAVPRIDIGAVEAQEMMFVVDTLEDEVDGDLGPGKLSLREAIELTNLNPGHEIIRFAESLHGGTISLIRGELHIFDETTILGPGANLLTIDASTLDPTPDVHNGDGGRIFRVEDSIFRPHLNVSFQGLTLAGGDVATNGGAIYSTEAISLVDVALVDNSATYAGGAIYSAVANINGGIARANHALIGGAIWAGRLETDGAQIVENVATNGGGIYVRDKGILRDTTVALNVAMERGGGILAPATASRGGEPLEIYNSSIRSNHAAEEGGGILLQGQAWIENSTIADNFAKSGSAVHASIAGDRFVELENVTVSGNQALTGAALDIRGNAKVVHSTITRNVVIAVGSAADAGGISATGTLHVDHSIIAGNIGSSPDLVTTVPPALRFSLIGYAAHAGLEEAPVGAPDSGGNLIGGPIHGAIDPRLAPLADNGGTTWTHALLPDSPAVNRGDLSTIAGENGVPAFDQRGEPFGRVFGGRIDIGALELQQPSDLNLIVDTALDEMDGDYSRGDLSLREAIALANIWPSDDTIRFDPKLAGETILLTRGELSIYGNLTIEGLGADLLAIDASGNDPTPDVNDGRGSRVFRVSGGVRSSFAISHLTLTGADISGGVIESFASLILDGVTIRDNGGGGILQRGPKLVLMGSKLLQNQSQTGGGLSAGGEVLIVESQISGNSTGGETDRGGGVYFFGQGQRGGSLTVVNSVITGNSSSAGGGIYFDGTDASLAISGSTIADNHASYGGGGLNVYLRRGGQASTIEITDTLFANNSADKNGGAIAVNSLRPGSPIDGVFKVSNSTVSGNSAGAFGGGIWTDTGAAIEHSTIYGNVSYGNVSDELGGSIFISSGHLELYGTIVASYYSRRSDISGLLDATVTAHYSLIGTNLGSGLAPSPFDSTDSNGNRIGTRSRPIDPLLAPLADNGGTTWTHALLPGSPAIDGGDPAAAAGQGAVPTSDQRGRPFPRIFGTRIDIGAFEYTPRGELLGDYSRNGVVDAMDYNFWRSQLGSTLEPLTGADGNGDGVVDALDYELWKHNFGATRKDLGGWTNVMPRSTLLDVTPGSAPLQPASIHGAEMPEARAMALAGIGRSIATGVAARVPFRDRITGIIESLDDILNGRKSTESTRRWDAWQAALALRQPHAPFDANAADWSAAKIAGESAQESSETHAEENTAESAAALVDRVFELFDGRGL